MRKYKEIKGLGKLLPKQGKPIYSPLPITCRECGTKLIGGELDLEADGLCDVCRWIPIPLLDRNISNADALRHHAPRSDINIQRGDLRLMGLDEPTLKASLSKWRDTQARWRHTYLYCLSRSAGHHDHAALTAAQALYKQSSTLNYNIRRSHVQD